MQALRDSDSVLDKTFKWYKVAKNHRIVPFKTFSRNGIYLFSSGAFKVYYLQH